MKMMLIQINVSRSSVVLTLHVARKKVCIENKCVDTECRVNSDCPANHLCHHPSKKDPRKNKCKPVDCTSNAACKDHSNKDCKDGKCLCEKNTCVVKECVKSEHC